MGTHSLDCADCGVTTNKIGEYYMVQPIVWFQYGAGKGHLCIGCLEKRMGRELEAGDFGDAPINGLSKMHRSKRLIDRLNRNANLDMHVRQWRFVRSLYETGAFNERYLWNVCYPIAWGIWEW